MDVSEPPLRAELLSVEQLGHHAEALAAGHQVVTKPGSHDLLNKLAQSEGILRTFNRATRAVNQNRRLTPAAEWLLDNFYLIEEQIQMAKRHLPKGYSRELPRLLNSPSAGLPRVYDIVLELILHVDAQIDAGPLSAFVAAYQTVATLKLGELWAIPIMLRLGLIENLKRITTRLTVARQHRDLADDWVDRLQQMAETNPSQLVVVVADMAKSDLPISSSFVAEFCQRLSRQSPVLHLARTWLEQRLGEQGLSIEQLVHQESQNQAADQVSVSHSIASLRFLSSTDWKAFVEGLSLVESILRSDPSDVYARMDFSTRDRYRHSVEFLSRHGTSSEAEVARQAVGLAEKSAQSKGPNHRSAHVGFYLVDKGQSELASLVRVTWPWRTVVARGIRRFPLTFYAGGIATITTVLTLGLVARTMSLGADNWRLAVLSTAYLVCGSQLAVVLMNWLSTMLVKPLLLPRLDYTGGVVAESRTMVVVPTMLTTREGVDRLIEILEIHHLANRDPRIHCALLTDFRDAPTEALPGDAALLQRAMTGVRVLNLKYARDGTNPFYLFHRPRRWNGGENLWIGYERKRGKLMEFNALLRGGSVGRFSDVVGDATILPSVKYVITLDTDTQLPRDAARQLIGTMAHPLNRPEFDASRGIVAEGYSILQPRVGVSLPSARRSWFVRLFAGDAGIDPYTRAVSDVYQDVFREGTFIGKGIYDVDAFLRAMEGRLPENTVLSHDLLEACHARSALVTDVELFEEFPSRYNVDTDRRHRWVRGDWQITQWLLPRVPGSDASRIENPLSVLSQWKIFDNLRRSVVPAALMLLMPGVWFIAPWMGCQGSLLAMAIIALPAFLSSTVGLLRKPSDLPLGMHLGAVVKTAGRQLGLILLTLAFLPYDAYISLDAIAKTLLRQVFTHKRLLEWQTSSDSECATANELARFYATMWIAPVTAASSAILLATLHPTLLPGALHMLCLWFAAPWIAWWISQPIESATPILTTEQLSFLRCIARKTWHFFETFVNATENWLPPDNFQEVPDPVVASRTSPTNIGLALLANLAAKDLGYISTRRLLQRTEDTFATIQRLERFQGHLYNWYETRTLQPLLPLYVSSVDSGNLAGHLLTLGSGLREQIDEAPNPAQVFAGLRDTLTILRTFHPSDLAIVDVDAGLARPPAGLRASLALLQTTLQRIRIIAGALALENRDARRWADLLARECEDHIADMLFLAPWLGLQPAPAHAATPMTEATPSGPQPLSTPVGEVSVAPAGLDRALARLDQPASLRAVAGFQHSLCADIETALASMQTVSSPSIAQDERKTSLAAFLQALHLASDRAQERIAALESLAVQSESLAAMNFTFLYDTTRDLFTTGFNATEHRSDNSFYDLLASEARLCSYVSIALGQVPQDHWFSMGRLLIASRGMPILISWSGSMFEYLMPLLVMPNYENTLLDHTCKEAVHRQIEYGKSRSVPWGISESGYNRTDVQLNYQYKAFGVPGLGLKRGLSEDLVIAPYATVMALMVAPREACANLQRLSRDGREGPYGYYEAVDYTPSRLPPGDSSAPVRSFMAHHQGMSLLALVNLLREYPMQRRFMACPALRAADLLLQERVPRTAPGVYVDDLAMEPSRTLSAVGEGMMRIYTNPLPPSPEVHLLSNGRYHVAITSAFGGYSRWRDVALTRWREDATRDCWGTFLYLRDVATGEVWSAGYHPTARTVQKYEAIFTQSRAEFRHCHTGLEIHTEISVSPEDDVELRRVTITNRSSQERVIELTSYAEIVLAAQSADEAHPAFSNLFVQTEFAPATSSILCTRRPRSAEEKPPWLLHLLVGAGGKQGSTSCETDRAKFVGRGRDLIRPLAMDSTTPLSNTVGPVLDPIVALRRTVTLPPEETVTLTMIHGVAGTRDGALAYIDKYQSARMVDRAFDLAWTHSQVTLHQLDITEEEAQLYGRLAAALIYADPARRAAPGILLNNRRGQNGLWSYGISGDLPIVLVRISDAEKITIVRQLIQAHSYWRMKGLTVDLVILNEDASVYRQSLHDQILSLISSGIEAQLLDKPGGIFVRRLEQLPNDHRILMFSAARVVLEDEKGTLEEQLEHRSILQPSIPPLRPSFSPFAYTGNAAASPPPAHERALLFLNGLGGFAPDGREYVITLPPGTSTPAPWVNVMANPYFGTVVSESGSAYTWVENSHEFRLTPWSNDPVQDTSGEAFYIRDDQTGAIWSPTPLPARGATPYVVRHGFGYSVFEHTEAGIASELWVYVAIDAPVKFAVLKVRNVSDRPRRISVTGYWEWVLADMRRNSLLHVQTEMDIKSGALIARNFYNTEFPERIVFIDVNDASRTFTGDRREFLGHNGNLAHPDALARTRLSGKVGAGLDPCGAMQVSFNLAPGHERETTFRLGVARSSAELQTLIRRYRRADACRGALTAVTDHWHRVLGTVTVDTPDPAVNLMANGWLLYQTLSCRLWGRTGFYQSGGAYGFRDQLQDVLALLHAEPALTREHLLRAAARQFKEGDVQHWWHPPGGRGIRTHFADDLLWLPYATCRYVSCLEDYKVLDETIPFLEGRPLRADEESCYDLPANAGKTGTLYEHCSRAIEHALTFGAHGLPLMGSGDWNDGMNKVGQLGKGESVWLAFFLYDVLTRFGALARARQDNVFADRCSEAASRLQMNIEANAWDGQWYLRAYFDDGQPLGSNDNAECQIDSIPQSWSVISGAGEPGRALQAMESACQRLIRRDTGLIQLLDPPFDKSSLNPGYIKGYIPGVRENGGQYTHAAIWTALALAMQGKGEAAWNLFSMLNPVNHSDTPARAAVYAVEPYVVAADVYSLPPHAGRGGWTWYTGSAGWMYRLLVETLLGVNLMGSRLRLTPILPATWPGYSMQYRYRDTVYRIQISRARPGTETVPVLSLDGVRLPGDTFPLLDDRQKHHVTVQVPAAPVG